MLCRLIEKAQMNDKDAMMELVHKFYPLLKKYAAKLNYEDAYQDIVLYYIEFILKIRLDTLTSCKDEAIVSYTKVVVVNYYKKKVQKIIVSNKELVQSDLTQEQAYYMEARLARHDPVNVEHMLQEQNRQGKRLETLERVPAETGQLIKRAVITALAGGTVGSIVTAIVTLMQM